MTSYLRVGSSPCQKGVRTAPMSCSHLSKNGQPGGPPVCGNRGTRTGFLVFPFAGFEAEPVERRCQRCHRSAAAAFMRKRQAERAEKVS
jgi:hypothetical protein